MQTTQTFDALTAEYGNYSKDGVDYALVQHPYVDLGMSHGRHLVADESYYFASGYDREGNPVELVWEITNTDPDNDDESNACNWEEFDVLASYRDIAPWHADNA